MRLNSSLALLTLVLAAAPLAAQGRAGHIPPGQLPPKGMCRVWIDGVPPGRQPPVTDCVTAERNRVANSRVIYGDRESFPGNGRGKFKTASANGDVTRSCRLRDAVVVNGRVVNICRDDTIQTRRNGKVRRDDDEDDDDDRFENEREHEGKVKVKAAKAGKHKGEKHGDRDD